MAAFDVNEFVRNQFPTIFDREITVRDELRIRQLADAFGATESKSFLVEMIHKYHVECIVWSGSAQARQLVAKLHIGLMDELREQASSDRRKLFEEFMSPVRLAAISAACGLALGIVMAIAVLR